MEIITPINTTSICRDDDEANEDRIQSEYVLDVNDTFLHSIFGKINGTKIKQIMDHQLTLIAVVILGVVLVVLWFIFGNNSLLFNIYHITVLCFPLIPWLVFKHLLFNKVAFRLCLQAFDFWVKVGYGLIWSISSVYVFHDGWMGNIIQKGIESIDVMFVVLTISYISCFDAVHSITRKKLIISVFQAVSYSIFAVGSQFFSNDADDHKIMIQLANGVNVISLQSLIASSSRILAIFMWKSSYKAWKSKGRAVAISISPKITWIGGTEREVNDAITVITATTDGMDHNSVSNIDLRRHVRNGENDQESSESMPMRRNSSS
eukprot:246291_1